MTTTLTMVIHGEAGTGKTTLAVTAPGPRLILDAEGGTQWAVNAIKWDPKDEPPKVKDDDSVVVTVKDMSILRQVTQWVQSGKHPFKSVIVDSLMEIQKRMIDNIAGVNQMQIQDWGTALRQMEAFVRVLRDKTMDNGHSLPCVVFTAGSVTKDGRTRPFLQGQIAELVPYFVDVQGYLTVRSDDAGELERTLQIQPINNIAAKDRTRVLTETFGAIIVKPNIQSMMKVLEDASNARKTA
jgi:hypothetical protein